MNTKLLLILLTIGSAVDAQSFNSGSTGTDGALVLTTPGTILFDPRTFDPPLNPSGDNVYHFTSIQIGKNVTVKLSAKLLNGPVFWLVQGPVQIDGTLDLGGSASGLTPSIAGAGGYPGGAVRKHGYRPGAFESNVFLVPLIGGSGGDGGETQGGGAGGGALLIASSTSITVSGAITADGGVSADGIGGGGGAIRLVAPVIDGAAGLVSARGGQPQGVDGRIRFEAFDNRFTGSLNGTPYADGKPFGLFLPPSPPASVRVVSIGGIAVATPDLTVNQSSPVMIVIEARYIPVGTVLQLEFFSEKGSGQTVATMPLAGTFELSRATASVVFPSGPTRLQVNTSWTRPHRNGKPNDLR